MEEYRMFSNAKPVKSMRELSLGFSTEADKWFNCDRIYGDVDKAELLWRLGIEGEWDKWNPKLREKVLAEEDGKSRFFGQVPIGGFVCRLPSGGEDGDNLVRGNARARGLLLLRERADHLLR
jgi:hypothetical protein